MNAREGTIGYYLLGSIKRILVIVRRGAVDKRSSRISNTFNTNSEVFSHIGVSDNTTSNSVSRLPVDGEVRSLGTDEDRSVIKQCSVRDHVVDIGVLVDSNGVSLGSVSLLLSEIFGIGRSIYVETMSRVDKL